MPVPNDLTPEEEAEFSALGVAPAGQGMEPTGEPNVPMPEAEVVAAPHGDRAVPVAAAPAERARDAQGRFTATPEEVAAGVDPNAAPAAEPGAPPPGFVPHAALAAERSRAAEALRQNAILTARANAILASRAESAVEPLPDLATDPVAFVEELARRQEAFQQERQQTEHQQRLDQALQMDEAAFAAYTPDYEQAQEHYLQSRFTELTHMGQSPQQAQTILLNEARQLAQQAWQAGVPAAQRIYQLAEARGYRPGTAPAPQTAPVEPSPAPVASAPAGVTPAARIAAVRGAQAAAPRSMAGATGAAPAAELNAQALLAMSDEEFDSYFKLGTKGADARFAAIGG